MIEQTSSDSAGENVECFVIGPIGDRLAPVGSPEREIYEQAIQVWEAVIQPACDQLRITPIRADRISEPGEITEQVFRYLRDADVVIADVTGGNPNVMYELGLRHTRRRLTVQIGERGRLPFDINVVRTVLFNRSERGLVEAREALRAALEAGLRGEFDPVTATRLWNETETPPSDHISRQPSEAASDEDEPGFLELWVESEQAMPQLTGTIASIGEVIGAMGEVARTSTDEMHRSDARGGGAAGRLAIAVRFSESLAGHAATLEQLAAEYEDEMGRIDPGIAYLIGRIEDDPQLLDQVPGLPSSISVLARSSEQGMASLGALSDAVETLEPVARPIRPVARRIRGSLRRVRDASTPIDEWHRRLEATASARMLQG